MTTASISELKARLSRYLREVRRGGEVQVLDRGVPVARLVGVEALDAPAADERRRRLIAAGVLRAGSGDSSSVLETEPLAVATDLRRALDEDRDDRL